MIRLFLLFFAILIVGCGYKPTTYYTDKMINKNVYADVKINIANPEATVALKDSLRGVILNKFNSFLVPKKEAKTIIIATLNSVSFTPLQYDELGYVSMYRVNVNIKLNITNKNNKNNKNFSSNGYYDFAISSGAVASSLQKLDAIKGASTRALENIIANIVYAGR